MINTQRLFAAMMLAIGLAACGGYEGDEAPVDESEAAAYSAPVTETKSCVYIADGCCDRACNWAFMELQAGSSATCSPSYCSYQGG